MRLTLFPNPAQKFIQVEGLETIANLSLQIVYLSGKEVLAQSDLTAEQIDVSKLAQGIYFVTIAAQEDVVVLKFIKR